MSINFSRRCIARKLYTTMLLSSRVHPLLKNFKQIKQPGDNISYIWHRDNFAKRLHTQKEEKETFPLTKDEAIFYLQDVLKIPQPISLLEHDKLAFLDTLIRQTKYKNPFTALPYCKPKYITPVLTLQERKEGMMSSQGGDCVTINHFTRALLDHLGFRTYTVMASLQRWRHPLVGNHCATVVRDLAYPSSRHLFDIGCRYFLPPMSLDFQRSSPVYSLRNISYKLFYTSPGVAHFCTQVNQEDIKPKTKPLIYYEDDGCWEVLTTFRTSQPISLADSLQIPHVCHSNPIVSSFVTGTLLLVGYPDGLMVNITQHQCTTMTETGHKEVTEIKTKDQLIETITKYFPQLRMEDIHNAANFYLKD